MIALQQYNCSWVK